MEENEVEPAWGKSKACCPFSPDLGEYFAEPAELNTQLSADPNHQLSEVICTCNNLYGHLSRSSVPI